MKYLYFLCCLFVSFNLLGQDTLTVVAVGEAEIEKDPLHFITKTVEGKETEINKIIEVLKSDFDFYRNLFEVISDTKKSLADIKSGYAIEIDYSLKENNLTLKVTSKKENSVVLDMNRKLTYDNIRHFAHDLASDIYRALTGKTSIFKTKILFVSDKGSTHKKIVKDLYEMDFDGFNKKRLTHLNAMIISPALSHDNKKVLYSIIEHELKKTSSGVGMQKVKNINLYLLNLETKRSKLISNIDGINSGAIFNKTGDSIYLTLSYLKNADIYKMDLGSGVKRRITNHFSDDVDPHINSDESMLTFLSGRPGKAMIYTLDPTGVEKNVIRIGWVGRFNAAPRFNPTGTEIVFSSWVDDRFDIYRIDSDGKNLVRLTKNFGSNEEPWFSPDGEFIVFTSQRVITRKKAVQDVYIMNREGEVIRKISENYGKIYTPRWSN